MKISKQTLIDEVEKYNKIAQFIQEKEQERLKILGKIEFIESQLKDDEAAEFEKVKDIKIDEVLQPTEKSGKKTKKKS